MLQPKYTVRLKIRLSYGGVKRKELKISDMENMNSVLMPVNQQFIDVFQTFMDNNQKTKIRANNVRQYVEGIIDLLLKDKIEPNLKENEKYSGINWGRKIKIIREKYDESIAEKIQDIFMIGGEGSHFNGQVSDDDLLSIIEKAIHIVEDMFIKYFLTPGHEFGNENIFTIFSMLPLHHRIYILENVSTHYKNEHIVDRLSLAYVKSDAKDKAISLLEKSLQESVVNENFYLYQLNKINILSSNLAELYEKNADYKDNPEYSKALVVNDHLVVGLPTSKDIFDTAKAVEIFRQWFETGKEEYSEFVNLFLCLMATDNRQYE